MTGKEESPVYAILSLSKSLYKIHGPGEGWAEPTEKLSRMTHFPASVIGGAG